MSVMLASSSLVSTAQVSPSSFQWSELQLPTPASGLQLGAAGVFAGFHHTVFIVAGGANFPDKMPWEGGAKKRQDNIYILQEQKGKFHWLENVSLKLPRPLAYGVSVSVPEGVFCAGGETENGSISKAAFLLSWQENKKQLELYSLPDMPLALANAAVTCIGSRVFVAGGETGTAVSDQFFCIDLAAQQPAWENLPSIPMRLSHSVALVQQNANKEERLFLVGGRAATATGVSELHGTLFAYDPGKKEWVSLAPIQSHGKPVNLSAATAVTAGKDRILVWGGDRGEIFHRIEILNASIASATDADLKAKLITEKKQLLTVHPGFNKEILEYNTCTNSWRSVGELPFPAQVTTTAVKWKDRAWIPSGEIRPGVRTPVVHLIKLK